MDKALDSAHLVIVSFAGFYKVASTHCRLMIRPAAARNKSLKTSWRDSEYKFIWGIDPSRIQNKPTWRYGRGHDCLGCGNCPSRRGQELASIHLVARSDMDRRVADPLLGLLSRGAPSCTGVSPRLAAIYCHPPLAPANRVFDWGWGRAADAGRFRHRVVTARDFLTVRDFCDSACLFVLYKHGRKSLTNGPEPTRFGPQW